MSADSFHASVEKSLQKRGNVFEFYDFVDVVDSAQFGRVVTVNLTADIVRKWEDSFDRSRIQKLKTPLVLKVNCNGKICCIVIG